jgi:hypothetical protein
LARAPKVKRRPTSSKPRPIPIDVTCLDRGAVEIGGIGGQGEVFIDVVAQRGIDLAIGFLEIAIAKEAASVVREPAAVIV